MPSSNIPDLTKARQDLPHPDSRIGALDTSLYGMIIHAALSLLAFLNIYVYIIIKVKKEWEIIVIMG